MNWIFEVYGNTYNAILLQNRNLNAAQNSRRTNLPVNPFFGLFGFGDRNR